MELGELPSHAEGCHPEAIRHGVETLKAVAERKAWDSLARYKFVMFGYWAAVWVHLNRLENRKAPNPFTALVKFARGMLPPKALRL